MSTIEKNNDEKLVKIKFDGRLHQVDAQVFINTLVNFSEIIKELNRESASGKSIEIKIIATEKGSFDTHIIIQAIEQVQQLFTKDNIDILAGIVTVTGGLFKLRQWLSKRKKEDLAVEHQDGDKVSIQDTNGDVIVVQGSVYNTYINNQVVNDAISNTFAVLDEDPSITGLELADDSTTIFRANKEEFSDIATKVIVEDDESVQQTVSAMLTIRKLVFEDSNRKWEFIYMGNPISANILDKKFFERIDKGEKFAKGDQLAVDLEITKTYDDSLQTYLNKSYTVVAVNKHIPRDSPQQIDILNQIDESD